MRHRGKLPKGLFYPKGTEIIYIRFTNEFGKQVAESSKGNDKEVAEALLIRRRREVLARRSPVAAAILEELKGKNKTFQEFLDDDYYPSIENTPSGKTREYTLKKFAVLKLTDDGGDNAPMVGDLLVRDIGISHLLRYKNSQRVKTKNLDKNGKPVLERPSNGTLNRHREWILGCLSYAASKGYFHKATLKTIREDVNYKKLPEQAKPPRAFNIEHLHAILSAAEKRNKELYQVIRFAIATGIRKGKIFDFKWSQVNYNKNEISSPPKNQKSKEWLVQPISEPVRTVLEERKAVRQKNIPYVFFNPKTKTKWNNMNKSWWHVLEDAGIRLRTDKQTLGILARKNAKIIAQGLDPLPMPEQADLDFDAVFHGLRHSFGSHLNDMKIPIMTCMLLLGHSNIKTTEKYLKSLRGVEEFKKDLDKLEVLINHNPAPPPDYETEYLVWEANRSLKEDESDDWTDIQEDAKQEREQKKILDLDDPTIPF
jgi:integrase